MIKHCYKWKDQQAVMWKRVKEAMKRGKQKWCVGDLLADETCSRLLTKHPCRKDSSTGGEELGQREEAEAEEMGDGRSKLGIGCSSLCFLSVFSKCELSLVLASLVFTRFISLVLSQFNLSAEGAGVLPSSPTFGPRRQTGTG